ncbi:hypothetical protein HYDPIDRAFT_101221 [Hydnomerulius pinastri MD-312]|uniref:non-specific serine/threonine protein kinase n=1 Tax=Hydnomerulius pinastri MD-312 TaxID=994086 RepID=A0A0C9VND3_9AGAM|nr:hypothetical protein HYDPIDRAFT_101221 [Hydnomerulius pinastri MD-312]
MDVICVDGRYRLGEKLGSGSYATVYRARDIITEQVIAVKLEPITNSAICPLEHEYSVLNQLKGTGLPRPLWFGREGSHQVMVLENLGASLDKLLQSSSTGAFELSHVAELGLQMISRLEHIHSHNFIHRDVKPQNIVMGTGDSKDIVFLIDFSIAKQYHHPTSRIHIPMKESGSLVGTPAFASLNSHFRRELSCQDDLEALAYSLMFLHRGSLPWLEEGAQCSSIRKFKESLGSVHYDIPEELLSFLMYVRSLSFMQKPDYDLLWGILLPARSSLALVRKEVQAISVAQPNGPCGASDDGATCNTPVK